MLYVGKCPPKTQHASTKEKSSGDWKTPDKKKTDKKQVGRSSKPRTPQMDRKKMGKKVENKDEKKPLRKQIQYEKVCLKFVCKNYLFILLILVKLVWHFFISKSCIIVLLKCISSQFEAPLNLILKNAILVLSGGTTENSCSCVASWYEMQRSSTLL